MVGLLTRFSYSTFLILKKGNNNKNGLGLADLVAGPFGETKPFFEFGKNTVESGSINLSFTSLSFR
jgi:hypothetical protein